MKNLSELFDENADETTEPQFDYTGQVYIDSEQLMSKETFIEVVEERELDIILDFQRWYNKHYAINPDTGIDTFDIEWYLKEREEVKL